jgi:hypothetical protein
LERLRMNYSTEETRDDEDRQSKECGPEVTHPRMRNIPLLLSRAILRACLLNVDLPSPEKRDYRVRREKTWVFSG